MKVSALTILSIFFLKISIFAQQKESLPAIINYLGIGIGYNFDNIKDSNFSPLNQKGTALYYSIFYEQHSKNILKINAKYGDGTLNSGRLNKLKTSYYKANIGIAYLKNIFTKQQSTNFYIGGSYSIDILYMDWYNQDAFSYFSTNGLSISAAISKQFTAKQYIESTISIPVIQFLSRPPYNGLDEYIIENQNEPLKIIFNGKLASFKEYKSINWNINYKHEISNHFNLKIDYDLNIKSAKSTHTFTSFSNRISTSVLYKFPI
ncbi:hypothetical protein [Lutibacter citreus]|uniref:hypothetical protein n=1 Tax=Lutibacter citreus TaxID=2138210 RepID=UPI000DBE29F7|nr:hypothetical protein [Lutibacter citreus]